MTTFALRRSPPPLPHSGKMHWLDWAEISDDGLHVRAGRRIVAGHPFVLDGKLIPSALIELLAQAAAAGAMMKSNRRGKKLLRGVLASISEMHILAQVNAGDDVTITGSEEARFAGFTSARLEARVHEKRVASARMTFHLQFE